MSRNSPSVMMTSGRWLLGSKGRISVRSRPAARTAVTAMAATSATTTGRPCSTAMT
jgi:hypothetical protein